MNRDQAVAAAKRVERNGRRHLPKGARLVVVVTGEDGAFVGVSHNTTLDDCEQILTCALKGEDFELHHKVIDAEVSP
jgi:hypothetical protein